MELDVKGNYDEMVFKRGSHAVSRELRLLVEQEQRHRRVSFFLIQGFGGRLLGPDVTHVRSTYVECHWAR